MTNSTLEQLAKEVGDSLKKYNLKIATAESCTGGGLAYYLTCIPGSSEWFERGFVTYSNQAKMDMLGVSANTLEQFGAVSEEVAREMAEGALKNSGADVSMATTGIAGPDGGSKDKPVGTVWIAWARNGCETKTAIFHYKGDRQQVREQTINDAFISTY